MDQSDLKNIYLLKDVDLYEIDELCEAFSLAIHKMILNRMGRIAIDPAINDPAVTGFRKMMWQIESRSEHE